MKTTVVTSRKWSSPEIRAFVSNDVVGAEIALKDYLAALVEEVGNPAMLMTKAALLAKLEAASESVLSELKQSTKYVV